MRPQSQRRRLRRQRIKVNREHHAAAQLVAHPGRDHQCPALAVTGRCLHSHRPIQTHRDLVGKVLVPVVRAIASAEHTPIPGAIQALPAQEMPTESNCFKHSALEYAPPAGACGARSNEPPKTCER